MKCKKCGNQMVKNGFKYGRQQWKCPVCKTQHLGGQTEPEERPSVMGLTEQALRQKHDTKFIIKNAAALLPEGIFLTQSEFVIKANIKAGTGYRDIIDHPDFDKYKGKAGGVIYWSHPDSINKLKMEGILR